MRIFYRSNQLKDFKVGDVVRKFVTERIYTPYLGVITQLLIGSGEVVVEWPYGSEREDPGYLYIDVLGQKAGVETLEIREDTSQLGNPPRREQWVNKRSSTKRKYGYVADCCGDSLFIEVEYPMTGCELGLMLNDEFGIEVDNVEEVVEVDLEGILDKCIC